MSQPVSKRTRRWYEALTLIKPQTPDNQFAFKAGWKAHERIQKDFPNCTAEKLEIFTDETLPFDIGFHCDLWNAQTQTVFEIKPQKWYIEHIDYCKAQIAGYKHFKQAKAAIFLLYTPEGYGGMTARDLPTWTELREIALKSDELLTSQGL